LHYNEFTQLNERKILLLGSSPLISHIALNLLADKENWITVLDRKPPNMIFENPELQQYQGSRRISDKIHCSAYDLPNINRKFDEFDVIINHYCIHDSKYSMANPTDTYNTNIIFTQELMEKLTEDKKDTRNTRMLSKRYQSRIKVCPGGNHTRVV